jgi:hypothetical protein
MIRWLLNDGGVLVAQQKFDRPVVYLDHWAVRKLAADPALGDRFATALKRTGGTWAISLVNLMEFIKMTDHGQAAEFERLIDKVLPNLFFIDFLAPAVADRERAMQEGGRRDAPYGDTQLFGVFAHSGTKSLSGFSAESLVTVIVQQRQRLEQDFDSLRSTIAMRITTLRDELNADASLQRMVKASQEAAQAMPTLLMMRELLGSLLLDPAKIVGPNDATDFLHAVVPVAYCDFALLDSQWKHRVAVVAKRFSDQDLSVRVAQVFCDRPDDITQFFTALETYSGAVR